MTQANHRTIREAFEDTLANDGGTYDILTLADYDGPQNVWAVGGRGGISTVQVNWRTSSWRDHALQAFIGAYLDILRSGAKVLGTWVDDGIIHIDAVDLIANTDEAIDLGYERGEKTIYNLSNGRTLELS